MFDWTDDFIIKACLSFPNLKNYIMQAFDLGDGEQCIDMLFAIEHQNRRDL